MIIKNNYVIALLVFIGLVVAFNVAGSYDNSVGNQVTGMASFGRIGDLLNTVSQFIFNDILQETVIGSFILYTDAMIRLVMFIILYLIISNIPYLSGIVKHEKYAKVISALIALMTAIFIPQGVIYTIFGTPVTPGLFGGGLGLIFWGIAIFLPLYLLFLWLKHADTFSKFLIGFLFLGWFFVIDTVYLRVTMNSYLNDVWDILISFGSLACVVGAFWAIWKGFSSGSKTTESRSSEDFIKRDWDRKASFFKNLFGNVNDKKTNLADIDRLANKYANAIRQLTGRGRPIKEAGPIISRYLSEAGRMGIGVRRAKQILRSKRINV